MRYSIIAAAILTAAPAGAQDDERSWKCLWVEDFDVGEQLVTWCDVVVGEDPIPCFDLMPGADVSQAGEDPWIVVARAKVTEILEPNDGACPHLPDDVPDPITVRGD